MKKVLSLVLTFVMVVATFAMLVPTASAASAEPIYENDFSDSNYVGKTDTALADAIFGAGNHNAATMEAKLSLVDGALKIDTTAAKTDFFNMVLSTEKGISDGFVAEMDYTFGEWDAGTTNVNGRFISFSCHEATKANWTDMTVVGPYSIGYNQASPNARVGSRPKGDWKGLTGSFSVEENVINEWNATFRMRATVFREQLVLEVARYDQNGDLGDYVQIGKTTDVYPENTMKDILTFCCQKQNVVTVDNILVVGVSVKFPEAPAVTTSAGTVLYTQDFSNATYVGKTDATLADAIFGEGNHNVEAAGAVLSIVDGALKIDTSANKKNFQAILFENAVISEGYVAEMDYTFGNDFATPLGRDLNGRFMTFTTSGAADLGATANSTVVGPYSPGIAKADFSVISGSPNARVCTRPVGNDWSGVRSYGTSANVNTLDVTYRMKATITRETLKLEVAKYTDGVLGNYVEIGTADHYDATKTLGDVVSILFQNESNVTIDNIEVTSLTSTPVNSFAGYQPGANQIRLVGLLDDETFTNATAVGFKVAILGKGEFKNLECNYVYESIDSNTAASLNAGYDYLYAMHITDIPAGEYSFRVVPYYVVDGNTVYGAAKDFVVNIANAQ